MSLHDESLISFFFLKMADNSFKNFKNLKCVVTFNCFGYKNSVSLVHSLCLEYGICFLNEHWLKPCEIPSLKSKLKKQHLWSVLKSSMDPEKVQTGRSHGGVGFICKQEKGIEYRDIKMDNNRLCVIQVICGKKRHQHCHCPCT